MVLIVKICGFFVNCRIVKKDVCGMKDKYVGVMFFLLGFYIFINNINNYFKSII